MSGANGPVCEKWYRTIFLPAGSALRLQGRVPFQFLRQAGFACALTRRFRIFGAKEATTVFRGQSRERKNNGLHNRAGVAMQGGDAGRLIDIIAEGDDPVKAALETAAVVTALFAQRGHELVVVGGAAIEFYTEGAYMSGDIDLCRTGTAPIAPRKQQEIMAAIHAEGGPRTWRVGELFVDLLGFVENESRAPYRTLETRYGPVSLIPPELLIVERTLSATYPQPNEEEEFCAGKLLAVCLGNKVQTDWDEVNRLAGLPEYAVSEELGRLMKEVEDELR